MSYFANFRKTEKPIAPVNKTSSNRPVSSGYLYQTDYSNPEAHKKKSNEFSVNFDMQTLQNKYYDLKMKNEDISKEMYHLQGRYEYYKMSYVKNQDELKKILQLNQNLKKENSELCSYITKLQHRVEKSKSSHSVPSEESIKVLDNTLEENKKLKKEIEILKNEMSQNKLDMKNLKEKCENCKYRNNIDKNKYDQVFQLNDELQGKNAEYESYISHLKYEVNKLKSYHSVSSKDVSIEANFKNEHNSIPILNEECLKKINDLEKRNRGLKERISYKKHEYECEISQLKSEIENLIKEKQRKSNNTENSLIITLEGKIDTLEKEKKNSIERIEALEVDLQKKQDAVITIRDKYKTLQNQNDELSRLTIYKSQSNSYQKQNEDYKQQIDQLTKLNENLSNQFELSKNENNQLKAEIENMKLLKFTNKSSSPISSTNKQNLSNQFELSKNENNQLKGEIESTKLLKFTNKQSSRISTNIQNIDDYVNDTNKLQFANSVTKPFVNVETNSNTRDKNYLNFQERKISHSKQFPAWWSNHMYYTK